MANHPQILTFPANRENRRSQRPQANRWLSVVLLAYWLAMFIGTHVPKLPHLTEKNGFDKVLHFGAYGGLALLLAAVLSVRRPASALLVVKIVSMFAVLGAFDEITQTLVGRDCELFDWYADVVGALAGSSAWVGAVWLRRGRTASAWDRAA